MLHGDFSQGFVDPVKNSQSVFRVLLAALANPGILQEMPVFLDTQLTGFPALESILLTLTGPECELALSAALDTQALRQFIAFHSGARVTETVKTANFVFIGEGEALPTLSECSLGTQEFPDRSATIVMAVPSLNSGPQRVLKGPGIEREMHFAVAGLPDDFLAQWQGNRELFPRGVDLIFVCGHQLLGLPRSARMVEA